MAVIFWHSYTLCQSAQLSLCLGPQAVSQSPGLPSPIAAPQHAGGFRQKLFGSQQRHFISKYDLNGPVWVTSQNLPLQSELNGGCICGTIVERALCFPAFSPAVASSSPFDSPRLPPVFAMELVYGEIVVRSPHRASCVPRSCAIAELLSW